MTQADDPFFIIPAVIPEDAPRHDVSPGDAPTDNTAFVAKPAKRVLSISRPTVIRTSRTIRHIDPWSVLRVALIFHFVLYLILLLAGVLLWNVANATGSVDNIERFMESFGWDTFAFKGGEIFHQGWILGLFGVVGLTGIAVLAVTTFNLITDLVGGIRLTVLEEKFTPKTPPVESKPR